MRVIAVYNIKGGVGKTAAAVNLAHLCARDGARTLLWDLDPQAAATFTLRVRATLDGGSAALVSQPDSATHYIKATDYEHLDLLPADFGHRNLDLLLDAEKKRKQRLRNTLESLAQEYQFVFIDCAPGISLVSENVFRAAHLLLMPVIPTTLSVRALDQLTAFVDHPKLRNLRVLSFFSMVDGRKRLHREIMHSLAQHPATVLRSYIPYSSDVERMGLMRAPVEVYAPRSAAAHAFRLLWRELSLRLEQE